MKTRMYDDCARNLQPEALTTKLADVRYAMKDAWSSQRDALHLAGTCYRIGQRKELSSSDIALDGLLLPSGRIGSE